MKVTIGPVEYIVIGFPGNKFTGQIIPELQDLVQRGTIRILDLIVVTKDVDGRVSAVEVDEDNDLSELAALDGEVGGLISEADVDYVANDLEPNSSLALLVWEDVWATPLVDAMRGSGGVLVDGARVPHDLVETAMAELQSVS
jgi:hypothetical protein